MADPFARSPDVVKAALTEHYKAREMARSHERRAITDAAQAAANAATYRLRINAEQGSIDGLLEELTAAHRAEEAAACADMEWETA